MTLADILPDENYRFALRFGRGEPLAFFAATANHEALVAERRRWLTSEPKTYAALLPEGEALLEETIELAGRWNGFHAAEGTPWGKCLALGEFWEADYLMLKLGADGEIRLQGGCLCFPSSWRLADKIGKPIEFIHGVVPGLNANIGSGIHKFLAALKPGMASLRSNWGLSRSAEWNQHPDRHLPRLDGSVKPEEVWLRAEHQALVALPKSGGILFGIRIENHLLGDIKKDGLLAGRLSRALQTMPEEMAQYKGLAEGRAKLAEWLVS